MFGFDGGGAASPGGAGRTFTMFGFMLVILAAASLAIAVANTVFTYINFEDCPPVPTTAPAIIGTSMCPEDFVYISSGIWGSIPVFILGILTLRIAKTTGLRQIYTILLLTSALLFTPAMIIINALEIAVGNNVWYTLSGSGIGNTAASSTTEAPIKFGLPLVIALLALVEMIITLLMLLNLRRKGGLNGIFGPRAVDPYTGAPVDPYTGAPFADPYGDGYGGYGGYDDGFGFGDGYLDDWGLPADMAYDPYYGDAGFGAPAGGPTGNSGGGGGGGGGGSSSAAASGGGAGAGGASNNNNNNIVVPPVIFPPQQSQPFPIYLPGFGGGGGGSNPVVVTTTSNPPGPPAPAPAPAPTPVFLPLPAPKRRAPPPARPVLRPLPPTRYYPHHSNRGASYMGGLESPFSGKPWNRL